MPRRRPRFACIGLVGLAVACTQTVPDTRDAAVKAVKSVEAAWVKDIATKDVDKTASYYSDDASFMMPNAPVVNGRENIKAALRPMLADPNFALAFQSTRADASKGSDLVYTVGAYAMTVSRPSDKTLVADKGNYLHVFKKQQDGSWKAVADMISSDLPARTEPARTKHPQHKSHKATHKHKHSHPR